MHPPLLLPDASQLVQCFARPIACLPACSSHHSPALSSTLTLSEMRVNGGKDEKDAPTLTILPFDFGRSPLALGHLVGCPF